MGFWSKFTVNIIIWAAGLVMMAVATLFTPGMGVREPLQALGLAAVICAAILLLTLRSKRQ